MSTFTVTVQFSGTKTYEINAENETDVSAIFERLSSFDNYDNPIEDKVSETIVKITEKSVAETPTASFQDVSHIIEHGLTQKLSNSIRVF